MNFFYITPSILTRDVDMEFLSVIPPCVASAKCWYCVQINPHSIKVIKVFLPRDALHSAAIAVVAYPSHAGIVSKHIKISSNFFLGLVAPPHRFSSTTYGAKF